MPRPAAVPPGRRPRQWIAAVAVLALALSLVFVGTPATAADGSLDTSFDGDGVATTDIASSWEEAWGVALQPDGKIVAAGLAGGAFGLARYNAGGSLDATFDGDGVVTTGISTSAAAFALAVQPDGKIVAAGQAFVGSEGDFALARYNPDGSLDTTFDGDGVVTTGISGADAAYAMALQPDGKIVAAGRGSGFTLVRYNADGLLDTSFDGDGVVVTDVDGLGHALAVAVQPDGKIVAAGPASNGSNNDFALARYDADGSLDTTFGGDGITASAVLAANDVAWDLALQPDGKIVAAGRTDNGANTDFALARYNTDGSLDTTFDGDGVKAHAILPGDDGAFAVAVQPDGKIVAAGYSSNGDDDDFALARYNPDGSLDPTFDGDGITTHAAIPSGHDGAYAAVLQPDGKVVAAGVAYSATGFALVRVNLDATAPWGARMIGVTWYTASLKRRLAWTASDNWAVGSYDVRYQAAPATSATFGSPTTLTSATALPYGDLTATPGKTFCFSVRARDTAGNLGPFGERSCMATPVDDRGLSAVGAWTSASSQRHYRSTYRLSTTAGAKLTLVGADFHRLAVVVTACPSCGKLRVYLGSTLLKEIDTHASATRYKQVIPVGSWTTLQSGTVTIKQQESGKKVVVDGLVVSLA